MSERPPALQEAALADVDAAFAKVREAWDRLDACRRVRVATAGEAAEELGPKYCELLDEWIAGWRGRRAGSSTPWSPPTRTRTRPADDPVAAAAGVRSDHSPAPPSAARRGFTAHRVGAVPAAVALADGGGGAAAPVRSSGPGLASTTFLCEPAGWRRRLHSGTSNCRSCEAGDE